MIDYFFIQLKSKIFGKKNFLIFVSIICFSIGLTYIYNTATEQNIYDVGIIDLDQSETSRNLIELLNKQNEINLKIVVSKEIGQKKLKTGDFHILYTIRNGFEEALKNGKYKSLLGYSKESSMQMTAWLNDFITLKVLKEWAYYDLYSLIEKKAPNEYTVDDYAKAYNQNLENNKIISLVIESLEIHPKKSGEEKKIFLSIISVFMMLVTMSYGKEVLNERKMNIVNRLNVTGISEIKYLLNKGTILWIYLMIVLIISTIGLSILDVFNDMAITRDLLVFTMFIIMNYLVTLVFVYLMNEKGKYLLITQGYILFSILMSSDLFKGSLPLVNQVKGFFPLTYLFGSIL